MGSQTTLSVKSELTPEMLGNFFSLTPEDPDGHVELKISLLRRLKLIATSEVAYEIFMYALRRRAFTAKMAITELDIPESSFYRGKKRLIKGGFIVQAKKAPQILNRKLSKGGPRSTIFALEDYTPEDINRAIHMHECFMSEKFAEATRVSQMLLEEYVVMEQGQPSIQYTAIRDAIKDRYRRIDQDFTDMIAQYLHQCGVKVWR